MVHGDPLTGAEERIGETGILPVLSTRRRTGIEPAWELSPPHRF